jgi:hypothetical protein
MADHRFAGGATQAGHDIVRRHPARFIDHQQSIHTLYYRVLGWTLPWPAAKLVAVLLAGLDQGQKFRAGVLLVEDSLHGRGHG